MKKTILEIYALAVCFFAVACFVITLGFGLWNIVEFSIPEFTINNHEYACHTTDAQYQKCFANQYKNKQEDRLEPFPTGSALTATRTSDYHRIIQSEQRQALQSMAQKAIILLINLLVFFAHWLLAKHARAEQ